METAVGILIGVAATIWVGRYYYRRTVNKELSIFSLHSSYVLAGIAQDVRKQLHFRFKNLEVDELQQVMFLVANTGERAIRDLMSPLRVVLPAGASVLDVSIVHREPALLDANLSFEVLQSGITRIQLDFPLLNKREFFVVKLLLSGGIRVGDVNCELLCDDLPRNIKLRDLPPSSIGDEGFQWPLAAVGFGFLSIPLWICFALYQLQLRSPHLFPYPWDKYSVSFDSIFLVVPGVLIGAIFAIVGLAMMMAAPFGGVFPPRQRHRFPLPKSVREALFPFPAWKFHPEFGETPRVSTEQPKVIE